MYENFFTFMRFILNIELKGKGLAEKKVKKRIKFIDVDYPDDNFTPK